MRRWILVVGLSACGGEVTTPATPECGNDRREVGELCDGEDLAGLTCPSLGYADGTLACAVDCLGFDVAGCHHCGDAVIEPPEVCDGDNLDSQTCLDHDFFGGTLACASDCLSFDFSACSSEATCGNGVVETPELCDGAALGGADCRTFGFPTGELSCRADCLGFDISGCIAGEPCIDALDCPVTARRCDPELLICVQCLTDTDCSCHETCVSRQCQPFGATLPEDAWHAHGTWVGTPTGTDYQPVGSCADDGDCAGGGRCNPFTAGCVPAAAVADCVAGICPGGYVCDARTDGCFPAALCADARNCCGADGLICVAGIGTPGMCLPAECTPPASPTSTCPLAPRETAECPLGGFCSLSGQCVECTCDAECDTAELPRCEVVSGTCVAADFCRGAGDCSGSLACDRVHNVCVAPCSSSSECLSGSCDPVDHVCYCQPDAAEPNDSVSALDLPELTLPAEGDERTYSGTLCDGDEDWLTMALTAGTRLEIAGMSTAGLAAEIEVVGPDGSTVLATGSFSDSSLTPLSFRAAVTDDHYLHLRPVYWDGDYHLQIRNRASAECDIDGANETALEATPVNDGVVASGCQLVSGDLNGNHVIDCAGTLELCVDDADFFSIHLDAAAQLTVTLDNFPGQDLDLTLIGPFDPAEPLDPGRIAAVAAGDDASEIVEAVTRGAAVFVVGISGFFTGGTTYDLGVEVAAPPIDPSCTEDVYDDATATQPFDADGTNDTIGSASGVALATTLTQVDATLCAGDLDWYLVGADAGSLGGIAAGHRLSATVTPATGLADLVVAGGSDPLAVVAALPEAGLTTELVTDGSLVYFAVGAGAGASLPRAYTLIFEDVAPPVCDLDDLGDLSAGERNDTPADATALASPWPTTLGDPAHTFPTGAGEELWSCAADDDWYRIDGVDDILTATILFDASEAELGLAIYDASVGSVTPVPGQPPTQGLLELSAEPGTGEQTVSASGGGGSLYVLVTNPTGWPAQYSLTTEVRSVVTLVDVAAATVPRAAPGCGDPGALARVLTVAASGYLADVDVGVDITTAAAGDMDLFLEFDNHGAPICVELSTANGGFSPNFTGTVFDDQAAVSIVSGFAPFTGHFQPESPLGVLRNVEIDGNWTLWVSSAFSSDATLDEWSLVIERSATQLAPTEPLRVTAIGQDGAVDLDWDAVASATGYSVYWDTSPGVTTGSNAVPVASPPWRHEGLTNGVTHYYAVSATNATGEGPLSTEVSATPSQQRVFVATPAEAIPDNGQSAGTTCGDTNGAVSTITVTETDIITDVDVQLGITHTYDGDLEILLGFDNGGTPMCVPLVRRRGASGDNFVATVLDDSATVSIAKGIAPFTGPFVPESPLAVLNGLAMNGTWTLYVYDTAGQDTGTLDTWSLIARF